MTRKGLVGWMTIAAVLGLVLLTTITVRKHLFSLQKVRSRLESTSLVDLRLGAFSPDRMLEIHRAGGLRLVAREYHPSEPPRATILLLHGSTPRGSRLAFYRVLGRRLAEVGFLVVSPDFAGFGESGDPLAISLDEGFSADLDVRAWLGRLISDPRARGKPLIVVAHSAGVSSGMPVGLGDPRVAGIVAIGPSRNVIGDLNDPGQAAYWWRRIRDSYRQVYGREFPSGYTKERWLSEAVTVGSGPGMKRPMERYLPLLQAPGHHPVLLIDGERELREDKDYLEAYFEAMAEPKEYETLSGSDHYSNVGHLGPVAIYDRKVVDATVSLIDRWITDVLAAPDARQPSNP